MGIILQISAKNYLRWRMRFFSIALLVALTFTMFTLYSAYTEISKRDTQVSLAAMDLHYDLLIEVEPGRTILAKDELPPPPTSRLNNQGDNWIELVEIMEPIVRFVAESRYGTFEVLGIAEQSAFYSSDRVEYIGKPLAASGEIVLPQELAEKHGLVSGDYIGLTSPGAAGQSNPYHLRFRIVGSYESSRPPQALILYEDALALTGLKTANACLFNYNAAPLTKTTTTLGTTYTYVDLPFFIAWLRTAYPDARYLSAWTPLELSSKLQEIAYSPRQGLLMLFIVFALIGVATIAIITYFERCREYAAYKSLGMSRRQMTAIFALEHGGSVVLGYGLGAALMLLLSSRFGWLRMIEFGTMLSISGTAAVYILIAVLLAFAYPAATALLATVNQLLFARRIALKTIFSDHLEAATGEQILRERTENVRLLKLSAIAENDSSILLFKEVGDRVKKGELIALQERMMGYILCEWRAICDGEVVLIEVNGLVGIRPDDPREPFYPYPAHLLELEKRRRMLFEERRRDFSANCG